MKALVIASLVTALSAGPALANTIAPPSPPPAQAPFSLQLVVAHGSVHQTYQLRLSDSCGSLEDKSPDWETRVKVCVINTSQGTKLSLDGGLRTNNVEYRTSFESTVQRGARIDVGRAGGVRFAVDVQ